MFKKHIYRPQKKFAKVFLNLSVILFTRGSTSRGICIRWDLHTWGCLHPEGGLHLESLGRPKPPGYYGIRSTSGRYASYWNAFLLYLYLYHLFVACDSTCTTCSVSGDSSKCQSCPNGKYFTDADNDGIGTCDGKFCFTLCENNFTIHITKINYNYVNYSLMVLLLLGVKCRLASPPPMYDRIPYLLWVCIP